MKLMFSAKFAATILGILFLVIAFNAAAQWSPGGTMVYMGDLNLAASPASDGVVPYAKVSPDIVQAPSNNSSMNSSTNDSSINNSMTLSSSGLMSSSGLKPLDLSSYAGDRTKNNLAGYKNIMYPISGSRGTTTSTAGGGCGCG
jgi:hypothetical protein